MESVVRFKKLLRMPVRKLTSCVSRTEERKLCAKRRDRRGRRGCNRLRKTPQAKAPSVVRSYQADLDKERKLREAMNAQKNAERAAMRAHFRRKYQLSENPKDSDHLRAVGGNVSLPHELSKMIYPESKSKDEGFNLLSAFQGLGLGTTLLAGKTPNRTLTAAPSNADSCKIM